MMEDPPFIGDWYRERKLGNGAYGSVYLWKNKKTNKYVAIKKFIIGPDSPDEKQQRSRWENEIDLMTNIIKCKNIVSPVQAEPMFMHKLSQGSLPVLALEYCEGGDLRRLLDSSENTCCGLKEPEVRNILASLRNAISYLHGLKITHRDLKPENIVLKLDDCRVVYKLTDLGLARDLDGSSVSASFVGTMEYLAPELLTTGKYSNSVDYWSLGVIAFEIISGVRPFLPHCPIARWMVYAQKKTSEDICITEDNQEEFTYHKTLFPENRISKGLAEYLKNWLRLVLEWNPKQRGYAFVTATENTKPTPVLKVFSALDEILNKKFLNIFSLFNYEFFSIEITENTLMKDLLDRISIETGIEINDLEILLPLQQVLTEINLNTMKPIDLYMPELVDQPMLYVLKNGIIYNPEVKPRIPKTIQDVFRDVKTKLKPHMLRQFARNAVYFVQMEQTLYYALISSIHTYALDLNDKILKFKPNILYMLRESYSSKGAFEQFNETLEQTKAKLIELKFGEAISDAYTEQCDKIQSNINALCAACEKISRRFDSALRRSQDAMSNELLKVRNEDVFNVKVLNVQFNLIRTQIAERKTIDEKSHINILNSVYTCLKKRDKLLMDAGFKELCKKLIEIKIEAIEIMKAVELADSTKTSLRKSLMKLADEHMNTIWSLVKVVRGQKKPEYLPDFEGIMQPKFNIGGLVNGARSIITRDEFDSNDTKSIIAESQSMLAQSEEILEEGYKYLKELKEMK